MRLMQLRKPARLIEVDVKMIFAYNHIGIQIIFELCQRRLDGRKMPDKRKVSVMVPLEGKKRFDKLGYCISQF